MKRTRLTILATLVIVALLLPACGATAAPTAAPTLAAPATKPAPTQAAPKIFIFGNSGDAVSLDPAVGVDGESLRPVCQLYDTLVGFQGGTTYVQPALAESWTVSEDGKVWTFKLRQNVKFHDGTPFNADAVVFTFERWMDVTNPYHKGGDFVYWQNTFGGFKNDPKTEADNLVVDVKAIDQSTVQFTLKKALGPFLADLAISAFSIISPSAIKKDPDNFFKNPVGTGAFKFVEWVPGDHITVEANKEYWGEKAKVDRVVWTVIKDNAARYLQLKAGAIHGMEGANPEDVVAARKEPNLQIILRPSLNYGLLGLDLNDPNLSKLKVRQAVAHAINLQAIVDTLFAGLGEVATQCIPPSVFGHNPDLKPYSYDPEMAKSLLKEAGLEKGFTMEFWYMPVSRPYMPDPKPIAEAIAADLAKVGIKTEMKTEDWGQYLTDRTTKFAMYQLGGTGNTGDPDGLGPYYLSRLDTAPDPALKAVPGMLIQARTMTDISAREKMYQEISKIVYDNVGFIFLAHTTPPLLFSKAVGGYVANPTTQELYNTVTLK